MRIIVSPNTPEQHAVDITGSSATIGRARDNTLVIDGDQVADYHARLSAGHGEWFVADLSGRGDVLVDGAPADNRPLSHGSRITVGGVELLVVSLHGVQDMAVVRAHPRQPAPQTVVTPAVVRPSYKLCPACGSMAVLEALFCPGCGLEFQDAPEQRTSVHHRARYASIARLALLCSLCGPLLFLVGWLAGGVLGIAFLIGAGPGAARRFHRYAWWAVVLSACWIMALGAGIGYIAWLRFSATRIVRNETLAKDLLRAIALSEYYVKHAEMFDVDGDEKSEYVPFAKLCTVSYHQVPQAICESPLQHDYYFTMRRADENGFVCTALPWRYGITGRRSFWIDERGVVFAADLRGGDFTNPPPSTAGDMSATLIEQTGEELAGDLRRAATQAFDAGQYDRCKRIIANVRALFPSSAASKELASLEQSTDPFIIEFKSKEYVQRADELLRKGQKDAAVEQFRLILRQFPTASCAAQANRRIIELTKSLATSQVGQAREALAGGAEDKAFALLQEVRRKYSEAAAEPAISTALSDAEAETLSAMEKRAQQLLVDARFVEGTGDYERAYNIYLSIRNRYGKTQTAGVVSDILARNRKMVEESEAARLVDQILSLSPEQDGQRILALVALMKRGYARTDIYVKNQARLTSLENTCHALEYVAQVPNELSNQNYRAVLANLEMAVKEDPTIALTVQPLLEECCLSLGDATFASQDYAQAYDYYQRYLKLQPKQSKLNVQRLMECHYQLARITFQGQQYEDAEKHLLACTARYDTHPEYNFLYGQVLMNLNRWSEAAERFGRSTAPASTFARNAPLYRAYSLYKHALGEEDAARLLLDQDTYLQRVAADYTVVFDVTKRTNEFYQMAGAQKAKTTAKSFADLVTDACALLDQAAAARDEYDRMMDKPADPAVINYVGPRGRGRVVTQPGSQQQNYRAPTPREVSEQRARIRQAMQNIPHQINVLRASSSADTYWRSKLLDQIASVRKLFQEVVADLNAPSGEMLSLERRKLLAQLNDKIKALRAAEDAFAEYNTSEEQRQRQVIIILEGATSQVSSEMPNAGLLRKVSNDLRDLYASQKEPRKASDGLRALSEAYVITPQMTGVILAEPTSVTTPVSSPAPPAQPAAARPAPPTQPPAAHPAPK